MFAFSFTSAVVKCRSLSYMTGNETFSHNIAFGVITWWLLLLFLLFVTKEPMLLNMTSCYHRARRAVSCFVTLLFLY